MTIFSKNDITDRGAIKIGPSININTIGLDIGTEAYFHSPPCICIVYNKKSKTRELFHLYSSFRFFNLHYTSDSADSESLDAGHAFSSVVSTCTPRPPICPPCSKYNS